LELKWKQNTPPNSMILTFNRTKLELKYSFEQIRDGPFELLIAPNWNWNERNHFMNYSNKLLLIAPNWNWNLVCVLIVFIILILLIAPNWNWNTFFNCLPSALKLSFNRTKLELKLLELRFWCFDRFLLIAPNWNWNYYPDRIAHHAIMLLIAPNWNWNGIIKK